MKKIILLVLCLTLATGAECQSISSGIKAIFDSIPGFSWMRPIPNNLIFYNVKRELYLRVRDSTTNEPLPNVYVNVKTGKNSFNYYTDHTGSIRVELSAKDSVDVLLSYMGYNTIQGRLPYPIMATATMSMKKNMIGQIIVKGNLVAIVNKGDTVSFNAAAFKTMKGDRMVDLFKKFPGMTFENGILKYLDNPIDQIRFDNKELFGNDAHLALETMWADDAIKVDVFKEESEFDKRNGIKGEKTRTIANVTTRSKPDKVVQTNLSLLAGYDVESSSNSRYATHSSVNGSLVNTTEKRTISATLSDNSNTSGGGAYTTGLDLETMSKLISSPTSNLGHKQGLSFRFNSRGNGNYGFHSETYISRNQDIRDNINKRDYFTDNRSSSSNSYNKQTYFQIGNKENFSKYFKDNSLLFTTVEFGLSKTKTNSESSSSSKIGDKELMNSVLTNNKDGISASVCLTGSYSKLFGEISAGRRNQFNLNYTIKHNTQNDDTYKTDTSATSTNPINMVMDGRGYRNTISLYGNFKYNISPKLYSSVNFNSEYLNSFSKQKSVNYYQAASGITDTLNTYNYTINDLKTSVGVNVSNNINLSKGEHWSYSIGGDIKMVNKQRDERFPNDYSYPRTFFKPQINASLSYKLTMFSSADLSYSLFYGDISLEQLRPYVDNTNTMFARVGNPDLEMPATHSISFNFRGNTKKGVSYMIRSSYKVIQNNIVNKNIFFKEDEYYEKYNYYAPAGSTLSTIENVDGDTRIGIDGEIDGMVKPIKSRVKFYVGYSNDKKGVFVNMNPSNIYTNSYTASLKLNSMFSSEFEISFESKSNINDYSSAARDSRSFSQIVGCNMKIIPSSVIKLGFNPIWNYYTSNANDHQVNNCLINGSIEYRIGKLRRNALVLNVYDILNTNEALKVTMFDDYIQTTMNATLGRYFMAGFRVSF